MEKYKNGPKENESNIYFFLCIKMHLRSWKEKMQMKKADLGTAADYTHSVQSLFI